MARQSLPYIWACSLHASSDPPRSDQPTTPCPPIGALWSEAQCRPSADWLRGVARPILSTSARTSKMRRPSMERKRCVWRNSAFDHASLHKVPTMHDTQPGPRWVATQPSSFDHEAQCAGETPTGECRAMAQASGTWVVR